MLISIAIPCYRSALTITSVVNEIREQFLLHPEHDYQLVLVNDGSPDETFAVIRQLCQSDDRIVGIDLSRNFSQANAKMAALHYVKGDVCVYMDDDGQHPACEIFTLVNKLNEGYDVVYAEFTHKEFSGFKIVTSDLFRKMSELVGTRPKGLRTSSFMAINRFAVEELKAYRSPSPSMGGYMYKVSTRFANVPMEQRERLAGQSGYTLKKMVDLAIQNLTNFTAVPLRFFAGLGIFTSFAGILFALILIVRKLCQPEIVMGYTSTMAVVLIFSGIILLGIGLLGEYMGRVYMMLSNQPQYAIREVIGAD